MRNAGQLLQAIRERRAQNQAIEAHVWRTYCGERKIWICTAWMWVRFGIYLIIGAFAGLGLVLALAPGLSLDTFALHFFVLWHHARALFVPIVLGAFGACVFHVFARAGTRMAKDATANDVSAGGAERE